MTGEGSKGRPRKYEHPLGSLADGELYKPASVACFAEAHGLLEGADAKALDLSRRRVRINMARWAGRQQFPEEGDGLVRLPGQAPTPGWYGRRWKASLE